jgi:hypothetical protein
VSDDDDKRAAALEALSVELADKGRLLEAGWVAMQLACIPRDAPPEQLRSMRMAFMGGAQHLFASIMTILDPGEEPSAADLNRMNLIDDELRAFDAELREWARLPP